VGFGIGAKLCRVLGLHSRDSDSVMAEQLSALHALAQVLSDIEVDQVRPALVFPDLTDAFDE
jgi:hypothetical protein